MNYLTTLAFIFSSLLVLKCSDKPVIIDSCTTSDFEYAMDEGCDGQIYPNPSTSLYNLPFPAGTKIKMGLSNCSLSYHGDGQPDQYAYDFDFSDDTPFYASRGGKVVKVVEDQSSTGGGAGNYLVVDHGDETFGLYYHSPENGIVVEVDQEVKQGDQLGVVGRSGLAGYPHLHFITVKDSYSYPYAGLAISFKNVSPSTTVLQSYAEYEVCE